jgi:hypothetical protein
MLYHARADESRWWEGLGAMEGCSPALIRALLKYCARALRSPGLGEPGNGGFWLFWMFGGAR